MGRVIIQSHTTKNPITLIGEEAGICYGTDTTDPVKNYKRGKRCIEDGHGRVLEFPQVYMILDSYSARVMREYYTHIGGAPTRLQASTRYITYDNFAYITPEFYNDETIDFYKETMDYIANRYEKLIEEYGMAKEDAANVLPLGMESKVVVRTNPRQLIDMAGNRECSRAYWEFQEVMRDIKQALSEYSEEWAYLVETQFKVKCDVAGYCLESECCGRHEQKTC